ncbi:MAG TPA: radical SAM protein [Polyangiaceae bacterium]
MSSPEGRSREFELQLGHLCNDRCVFCESGRLTQARQAPLLDTAMLEARVREAWAAGHRRITFLGGEPTLQPAFFPIVELAVSLGFERIVIFSNGSKAGSTDLVDRILATGGRFEWRFSVQGATRDAHERTTGRKGGFDQVLRALATVRDRGQRATVNLCLVQQNAATIDRYAELLVPLGVAQVHVDMFNPYDTGTLEEEAIVAMMPRYAEVAPALERTVRAFPAGFDVSVGSLPFCVAPSLAPWIHHDHHPMTTVTADDVGGATLKPARFLARTNRKQKPAGCASCVFDGHCTGVFDLYAERMGTGELVPVTAEAAARLDVFPRLVALRLRPHLREALAAVERIAPWVAEGTLEEMNLREVAVTLRGRDGRGMGFLFAGAGAGKDAIARSDWCTLRTQAVTIDASSALAATRALWSLLEDAGMRTFAPPGPEAFEPVDPSIAARLDRLRAAAPFGELLWTETRLDESATHAEVVLRGADDATATIWLAREGARSTGGYRLDGEASPAIVDGLGAAIHAVRG